MQFFSYSVELPKRGQAAAGKWGREAVVKWRVKKKDGETARGKGGKVVRGGEAGEWCAEAAQGQDGEMVRGSETGKQ